MRYMETDFTRDERIWLNPIQAPGKFVDAESSNDKDHQLGMI